MLREDYTARFNRGRDLQDLAFELDAISTNLTMLGYALTDGVEDINLTPKGIDDILYSVCNHIDRIAEELDERSISYR